MEFSLKEAAAIAGVSEPFVRKAIEAKSIHPRAVSAGRARRYRFGVRELLYLRLVSRFPLSLRKQDKTALREIVAGGRRASGIWRSTAGDLTVGTGELKLRVPVAEIRQSLARDLGIYRRGRRRIVSDPAILSGEPVFEGTRIPLAHISALIAKGVPESEIAEDYPALNVEDRAYAAMVAKVKRDPGRPPKPLRVARVLPV